MKILIQRHEAFRWLLVLALTGYAIWAWNAEAGDLTVLQPSISGDDESLGSLLEKRGWRVERSPDGSTLLYPSRNTPQATEAGDATVQQPSMLDDFESLRSLLETRGWHVERSPDGSTLLFPLQDTPQARQPAPADPHALSTSTKCAEEQQEFLFTAGVRLPVNTDKEAWQISANWLWASGYTGLDVGGIRNINWFYLVNIVDQRPPYRSRNELIINKRSGQLLSLY